MCSPVVQRATVDIALLCKDFNTILTGFQSLLSRFTDTATEFSPVVGAPNRPISAAVGVRRAVVIGIDYVGTPNELHGCTTDAMAIVNFLADNAYSDVALLLDRRVPLSEFKGLPIAGKTVQIPTRANIITAIRRMLQIAGPNDRCFLHYSGHGTSVPDTSGDETDGQDEMLVPLDIRSAGGITDDELSAILRDNMHPGTMLSCLMDCCHSGTVLDLPWTFGDDVDRFKKMGTKTAISANQPSILMVSGCLDSETSGDTPEGGIMTQAFLHSFNKMRRGATSAPTLLQLHNDMTEWIKIHNGGQHPVISCNMTDINPAEIEFTL